jgi:hypothetical protein
MKPMERLQLRTDDNTPQRLTRTREGLADELVELDERCSGLFQTCSREQLVWRPIEGAWSIAECIEHIALTNSQYLAQISTAIAQDGPPASAPDCRLAPGGRWSAAFLKRIGPQPSTTFKAPRKTRPSQVEPELALERLLAGHTQIRELLTAKDHPDLNQIRFRNPFIPVLRFTVATGLLIMAAHGQRHLEQAERVCNRSGFPGNSARQSA